MEANAAALTMERPAYRPAAVPAARPAKARQGSRVETRPGMKLSLRSAALFTAAFALLILVVAGTMNLSQLNREAQSKANLLQILKKEERLLHKQAETGVSLVDVEAYAVGELGMVKPTQDQIIYVNLAGEDCAEVIPKKGFWGSVKQLFTTITVKAVEIFD